MSDHEIVQIITALLLLWQAIMLTLITISRRRREHDR